MRLLGSTRKRAHRIEFIRIFGESVLGARSHERALLFLGEICGAGPVTSDPITARLNGRSPASRTHLVDEWPRLFR